MSDNGAANLEDYDGLVPDDFPRTPVLGAVAGSQPKFLATLYNGRYYLNGCTPPEIYERWLLCENVSGQLAEKSLKSKMGKRSHMTETQILEQYYTRLVATKWTSVDAASWIIRRTALTKGGTLRRLRG